VQLKTQLVSVIIPTFRRPSNLRRAINSAIKQTYKNIEIIIVDDNDPNSKSRKETSDLINEFSGHSKIKYLKHTSNRNGAAARNTGIEYSHGSLIAFLDDDDEWEPGKIESQVTYLEKHDDYNACYCLSRKYLNNNIYYSTKYKKTGMLTTDLLSLKSEIYTPALMFEKTALVAIGGFDDSFSRHQDFELLAKYFRCYKIGCVSDYFVKIHVDDRLNEPSFECFERNKILFLETFSRDINMLQLKTKNAIWKAHYFELLYYAFKKKNLLGVFYYSFKCLPGPVFLWTYRRKIASKISKTFH
jgi:glycosyltransferase involved in cell wall biosynthesis